MVLSPYILQYGIRYCQYPLCYHTVLISAFDIRHQVIHKGLRTDSMIPPRLWLSGLTVHLQSPCPKVRRVYYLRSYLNTQTPLFHRHTLISPPPFYLFICTLVSFFIVCLFLSFRTFHPVFSSVYFLSPFMNFYYSFRFPPSHWLDFIFASLWTY